MQPSARLPALIGVARPLSGLELPGHCLPGLHMRRCQYLQLSLVVPFFFLPLSDYLLRYPLRDPSTNCASFALFNWRSCIKRFGVFFKQDGKRRCWCRFYPFFLLGLLHDFSHLLGASELTRSHRPSLTLLLLLQRLAHLAALSRFPKSKSDFALTSKCPTPQEVAFLALTPSSCCGDVNALKSFP